MAHRQIVIRPHTLWSTPLLRGRVHLQSRKTLILAEPLLWHFVLLHLVFLFHSSHQPDSLVVPCHPMAQLSDLVLVLADDDLFLLQFFLHDLYLADVVQTQLSQVVVRL